MIRVCYPGLVLPLASRAGRLSRADYHRLGDKGVFASGPRVELIDGSLIEMSPQRPAHALAVHFCLEALRRVFRTGHWVRCQLPLAGGAESEPEPDVSVVVGRAQEYGGDHPSTAALVVEVADSTLRTDRAEKANLYARMGVREYWILNLRARVLEVHLVPRDGRYTRLVRLGERQSVSPLAARGTRISVGSLLPQRSATRH